MWETRGQALAHLSLGEGEVSTQSFSCLLGSQARERIGSFVCKEIYGWMNERRRTKEPLDESERGEWKCWVKTQHSENEDHGIRSHHFMANRWGNSGNSGRLFFWAPESLQMVIAAMKLKDVCSLGEKLWPCTQHIKKQRHYFANKGPSSQSYGFSSGHVWMWELEYKES